MNKPGHNRVEDERLYNRATFLTLFAIAAYVIFYSITFALEGLADKIWVVISGCAIAFFVVLLSRRARGILNPAFTVPFTIYLLYITGSHMSGRITGFFTIYFCICVLAMMYFNPWRFLLFIILANTVSLILILTGAPLTMGLSEQFVTWIFAVLGSLFLFQIGRAHV